MNQAVGLLLQSNKSMTLSACGLALSHRYFSFEMGEKSTLS
jgi:hypothetical protein